MEYEKGISLSHNLDFWNLEEIKIEDGPVFKRSVI